MSVSHRGLIGLLGTVRDGPAMGGAAVEFADFAAAELPGLVRFAGVLTGDRHLAHDVLTDALINASGRWSQIEGTDQPLAYVRQIVITTFLANRRRTARRRTDPTASDQLLDRAEPAGTERVDDRAELAALLHGLPGQQHTALVLRFYLDYPDPLIAHVLGCSTATVRSHISHALAALRAAGTTSNAPSDKGPS